MKLDSKCSCTFLLAVFLSLGACTPQGTAGAPSISSQLAEAPTVNQNVPLLYRGNAGRLGVYEAVAIRDLHGIQWRRSFGEDAYFPVLAGDALYIGTASGKLLALDPGSGEQRWSFAAEDGPSWQWPSPVEQFISAPGSAAFMQLMPGWES
jgi:outer membrane protein assembly factor BamB